MKTFTGLIGPVLILLFSVGIFVQSFSYDIRDRFWPQGLAVLIFIFCIPLIIGALKTKPRETAKDKQDKHGQNLVWIAILLTIIYLYAAEWLGYFISTALLMLALLLVFGERSKLMLTVLPLGTMIVIYGVFYLFLNIPLPTGLLF